jgi:hypothetical protein
MTERLPASMAQEAIEATLPMTLNEYLDGMVAASIVAELEAAIRAPFKHTYRGRSWARICRVARERGVALCDAHPAGQYVPRLNGKVLTVCSESYRVGRGYNSTGLRYVWHAAGEFAKGVLRRNGLSTRAASRIWDGCLDYPHRCLAIVEDALNGKCTDPPLNTLIFCDTGTGPINLTVAANNADLHDRRATRPCRCGGTLFDWGAGFSDDFSFVSWHCNKCPDIYTEYVTEERFLEIRARESPSALPKDEYPAPAS